MSRHTGVTTSSTPSHSLNSDVVTTQEHEVIRDSETESLSPLAYNSESVSTQIKCSSCSLHPAEVPTFLQFILSVANFLCKIYIRCLINSSVVITIVTYAHMHYCIPQQAIWESLNQLLAVNAHTVLCVYLY